MEFEYETEENSIIRQVWVNFFFYISDFSSSKGTLGVHYIKNNRIQHTSTPVLVKNIIFNIFRFLIGISRCLYLSYPKSDLIFGFSGLRIILDLLFQLIA